MDPIEYSGTFEQHLCENATIKNIPINGILELTPLCNMNCEMCFVRLSYAEMQKKGRLRSGEEWIALAKEMLKAGTLFVLLTGGEPLSHPDFKEIYVALRKMGMIVTINTNGTLIDEEWVEFFAKYPPRRINITLYGKDGETYDRLCHYRDGYERALNAIKMLKERNVSVKVNGSITSENVDDLDELISIVKELGVAWKFDTYMYPANRERAKSFNDASRLSTLEAARARVKILQMTDPEHFKEARHRYLEQSCADPGEYICSPIACRAGRSSFVINWQGKMRNCIMLQDPEESLENQSFSEAWEKIVEKTAEIRTSAQCNACTRRNVCQTCAACAKLETGSYDGVPEYMCEYTKATIEGMKKIISD